MLLGESWEEVGNRYREWKEVLEGKGLKVNVQKTKAMKLGGKKGMKAAEVDPCAVCRRRVMRNSIHCTVCGGWVHKRCSRVRGSLVRVVGFVCKRCCDDLVEVDQEEKVKLGSDEVEIVKEFCYLGDMLETEGGVEAAVAARVRVGWRKFKEISGMLCGGDVSMKIKGQLYKACVRSAMCYGAECWALRKEEVTRLRMAEMRMVRMMCGKTLKDKCQLQELRARVGVDDIEGFLRSHRLWWAGHVERAGEGVLKQVREMKVEGTRKKGRLRLTWQELVRKDMRGWPEQRDGWRLSRMEEEVSNNGGPWHARMNSCAPRQKEKKKKKGDQIKCRHIFVEITMQ